MGYFGNYCILKIWSKMTGILRLRYHSGQFPVRCSEFGVVHFSETAKLHMYGKSIQFNEVCPL